MITVDGLQKRKEQANTTKGITVEGLQSRRKEQALPFTDANGQFNPFALTQKMSSINEQVKKESQADALIGTEARKTMQQRIENNGYALPPAFNEKDIEAYKILSGKSDEEIRKEVVSGLIGGNPEYDQVQKEEKLKNRYDSIAPIANYVLGDLQIDLNKAYYEYSQNPSDYNKKQVERIEKLISMYSENAKNVGKGGIFTKDFATYLPQLVGQIEAGLKGFVAGGTAGGVTGASIGSVAPGIGTVGGGLAGFGLGGKAGYVGGVTKFSYEQMKGSMYKALIDLGKEYNVDITHEMASEISNDTAFLQALVEGAETAIDLTSMGISKLFGKGGAETIQALTRRKIIEKALKTYGINLVTETLEEGSQEKIAIEGEKKALAQVGIKNPYTKEQEAKRVAEAGIGGLKISAISGLGNIGGSVITSYINNNNVEEINKAYDDAITEINANEKLSTEEKQAQIATLVNERMKVIQKVKGEIDKNAENRTQISEKNAGNRKEFLDVKTDENVKKILSTQSHTGEVVKVGNEVYKNSTGNEAKIYGELQNDEHFVSAKLSEDGKKIITPYYNNVVSVDTIDESKRISIGKMITNKDFKQMVEAMQILSNKGILYNDTLQFAYDSKSTNKFKLFDFSNSEISTSSKVYLENYYELSRFLNKFGRKNYANIVDEGISLISKIEVLQDKDTARMAIEFSENNKNLLGDVQKQLENTAIIPTNIYYSLNARPIGIGNTIVTNKEDSTANVRYVLTDKVLSEKEMNEWELTPLYISKESTDKNEERYDAMPMTAEEKLEKWAEDRQEVYRSLAKEFGMGAMYWEANLENYTQEQAINFVSREWNVVKKFAEQNNIEIENTYNFEKRIRESNEFQEYVKNFVAPLYNEKPKLTSEELTELAQDTFGTTTDFTFGAFMTPDGKMLDFEEDGYRDDHNGIRSINYNVHEFVNAGNIRIKPEGNGFELSVEPTNEQYETLAEYIDDYLQGNIFVDITNEKGSPIAGRSYAENTPSSKIFNDIKEYFRTGKYPEKSELDDFRYDMMPETAVDSQNRKLSKGQQEYFKDAKIRDRNDNLIKMYHGTKQEFNVFDIKKLGNNMKSAGNYGDGFYFTPNKDTAVWYSGGNGNLKEVYLNIKNPFSYAELSMYNGEEYYTDYIKIAKLVNINSDWGKIPISYGSKQTWGDIQKDVEKLLKEGKTDSEIDNIMYDKYGDLPEELNEVIYVYAKNNNVKTLRESLIELGYDGIISSDTPATSNEIIAFYSNQIKNVDNLNPTDSDDIRYDLMPTMKDGFYSQLENVIINKMQKQAKASDIMNLIQKNGVKQDEIAWTGVDDFLASRDTVTKEELLQYIRASQLEVDEVIKVDGVEDAQAQIEEDLAMYESDLEYNQQKIRRIFEKYNIPYKIDTHYNTVEPVGEFANILDAFDEGLTYDEDGDIVGADGEPVGSETFADDRRQLKKYVSDSEELLDVIYQIENGEYEPEGIVEATTKYENWKTNFRGHSNYREVLYVAPQSTYTKALSTYKSPHWDEDNVIAHTRLQDYEDDGGAKVLFIEEIQSDLHQEGRRYGYKSKIEDYDKKINDLKDELQNLMYSLTLEERKKRTRLNNRYVEMRDELKQIQARHFIDDKSLTIELIRPLEKKTDPESHVVGYARNTVIDTKYLNDADTQLARESMGFSQEELERIVFLHNKILETLQEEKEISTEIVEIQNNNEEVQKLSAEIEGLELEKRNNYKKIDSKFPFKKNWHEFVIRKAINEAVQQGYDKVAWTTGEQQAERYDLRKHIDEIKYRLHDDGTFTVHVYKNGYSIESFENQTTNDLENLLGKSIAEKMINNEGEVEFTKSRFSDASLEWHSLSGLDLQVGGEGMKGFYDKIVPDYVNKYIKKWNSKVEEVRIPDYGGEVHVQQGFTITPEMRKSVQEIGQPLYDKELSVDTMSRKNIIDKFRTVFGIENFANTNKELNSIASDIRNKIKSQKITTTDIKNIVEELGERLQVTTDKYNGEFDDLKDELRNTKIYVSENAKKGFANWNDFRKNNFGTLRLTSDTKSIKISELYEDLQQKYGTDMFPNDIINESDQLEQIAEIAQNLKKENISIEEYGRKMYGPKGWQEIQQMMVDEIKAIRDEYDLENPIDTSKQARVANKETREILNALNIGDEEIYDPANAFVQNILETMEKDTEYFSRTLKEIEEENLIFGNKRVNTILNKRRYDVQSGRVKANPKYIEGASLSTIRKTIEAHIGKKIGLNGFRQRAYGIYKPTLDTIRIKDISNVETAIHELGHRINYVELNKTLQGASREELNMLAERAFGFRYDDEPDVKLEEGWAEFTKRFITDNAITLKEYPQLSAYMVEQLEGNKNMKKVVEKLIELSEQYVNAPTEKQIRKMQSVGQDTDSSDKRTFFGQYMYEIHDDLYDVKRMMKVIAKAMGVKYWDITPELNIYNLMRVARSNEDRVLNVMKHGLIDDNGRRRTEGLGELSELLNNDPEKIQKVRDLLIAMRTLDYTAVGLDTGLSTAEAMKLIKQYSKEKDVMRVANGIITFQDEVMKYAVEKGLMTKEQYEEMKKWNRFYIPLKRVFEGKTNSSSSGAGASKLTKRRTGSMRDIIDPFEAIIQNTSMILDKINQNEIMRALALLQERTGVADFYEKIALPQKLKAEVELNLFKNFLEEQGVDTDDIDLDVVQRIFAPMMNDESKMIMGYMEKGKLQAIEFKDRFVYEAISRSAGNADLGVVLERALSVSQLLRLGATSGNLEFAVPNMISDTFTAWMFSESGFVPVVDTLRGLVDYSLANYEWANNLTKDTKYKQKNKFLYDLYKQSGATIATRVGSYRPEVQEYVLEIFGKHANDLLSDDVDIQKKAGKEIMKGLSRLLGKTQDVLSILPELSEQATRFEHFKKDYLYARKQGHNHKNALLKATINTRDITMDFNRMGHTMRIYNRIRAFSGARAQGIYRFVEAVNKMPKKVIGKLGILAGIAVALRAGAGASGNKKEEEITDQVRKDNFIIPLGKDGEVVTIKKPQGTARSVINFVELLYDIGVGNVDEKDYDKAWMNWVRDTVEENAPLELDLREGNDLFSTIAGMALPTTLEPIIENALNKDFYYGNAIIPYGKEGLKPEDQYDENTSQTAILLGKVLKQSPAKIENLITGWTAGVGQQTLDLSDVILGKISKDIPDEPSKELSEKTILRRFFANSFKNSDSVSEVYEQSEKLEQLKKYEEASESELQTLEKLNSAKDTMSDLNKQIKGVRNSLTLTSDQKRDKIKELQILRTDVARNALGKELINPSAKEQVELYQYYPNKTIYKYEVHPNKTVEVEYTEDDMKEYARIVKDTYETALAKEEKKRTYKEMTAEEQKKKRNSLLTSAKSSAQEKVSREVYKRSR